MFGNPKGLFNLLLVIAVGLEVYAIKRRNSIDTQWIRWAIYTLLLACVIWVLDLNKTLCDPESILQGHALWHTLCALAIYFLYKYYEKIVA